MPHGITQCYLPPSRAFTPAEAGTRFCNPEGTQGWVDLCCMTVDSLGIKTATYQSSPCNTVYCCCPKMKLAMKAFPDKVFLSNTFSTFSWQLSNSRTFQGFPDKWSLSLLRPATFTSNPLMTWGPIHRRPYDKHTAHLMTKSHDILTTNSQTSQDISYDKNLRSRLRRLKTLTVL